MKNHSENQQVRKIILSALIPNFTAELSLSATSIVDGIVMGNFYGSKGLAAIGLGGPILSVFTIFAGLLGTGNSVLCSRLIGQASGERCSRIFSLTVIWAFILSAILTSITVLGAVPIAGVFCGNGKQEMLLDVAAYIRGFSLGAPFIIFRQLLMPMVNIDGGNRHIHISSVLILGTDALMDYIFSAWFDGGAFGLGLASALSYVFGCLPLLLFFIQKKSALKLSFRHSFSWQETQDIFKAGFPTAIKRICNVIAPVLTNRFILAVASVGAMSALSVQVSATRFTLCLVLALSTTFLLIAGTFYGEADKNQMEAGIREMFIQSMIWSIGISALFFIFAEPLASIFIGKEPEIADMAVYAIRWYLIGVPFMAINQCAASYLQAIKKIKASNWVITADRLISTVVLVYLLGWLFGAEGIFIAYGLSEILLTLTLYLILCVKNKRIVTKFSQMLLLPDDFGVSDEYYLSSVFHSSDDVVGFSRSVQEFALEKGIDSRRAYFTALCVEELSVNVTEYSLKNESQSLTVRIIIQEDGNILIRLRDDGTPFDLKKQWSLAQANEDDPTKNIGIRLVFGIAKEVSYQPSFGMNNTVIVC